jgi:hypothetical protein
LTRIYVLVYRDCAFNEDESWTMTMRNLFRCVLTVVLGQTVGVAEDYASFAGLPAVEKSRIVWELHEHKKWGLTEQKPICRDLLAEQGYSGFDANAIAWTIDAIELVEKQGWKDLSPPIAKIYERPKNIWVYERAFRYLHTEAGKPVSPDIIAAAKTLEAAGHYHSNVNHEQMSTAIERLLGEPDKEVVLVYAIRVATWHSGKGGTEVGRKAAADILKSLDNNVVAQRLSNLRLDCPDYMQPEVGWVAHYLGISLNSSTE